MSRPSSEDARGDRRIQAKPTLNRLRVRDTLTERKVSISPAPRKPVTLYVCGVTPYDSGHMGHAFTFSMFDVLVRFLEANGQRVKYVQNITDVDDPLFERARRDGGDGRPGWHIECTAMAMHYLGQQIDIHGGGRDLQFSHHESERAQSESLTGKKPFARAWVHTGLVRYEGHKMSKSRGNLVKVSQALQRAPAAAVRLYLVSHRYGRDWTFEWKGLTRSARFIERMRNVLADDARLAHDGPRRAPRLGPQPARRS